MKKEKKEVPVDYSESNRVKAAIKKIQYQFPSDPSGRLFCAVVTHAIQDLLITAKKDESERLWAIRYLKSSIPHARQCDVNPEWIRTVIEKLGIGYLLEKKNANDKS